VEHNREPIAKLIREGVEDLLVKYGRKGGVEPVETYRAPTWADA
jgi:hypothetical protein